MWRSKTPIFETADIIILMEQYFSWFNQISVIKIVDTEKIYCTDVFFVLLI